MARDLKNSIEDVLLLIRRKEQALSRNIDERAKIAIQQEIDILETMLINISDYQSFQEEQRLEMHRAILRQKDHVLALEAICIIHGIQDIPSWLNKGSAYLFVEALYCTKENIVQFPIKLKRYVPEEI